jgi:hypothetical protein
MSGNILFPNTERRPYYIIAPDYRRVSAGIRVLHLICHMLNLRGQSAFLTTPVVNGDWITPTLTEDTVDMHFEQKRTPIVICPETLFGNPFKGGCVVRYFLNYPGLLGGPAEFNPDELKIWYSEQMREVCNDGGMVLSFPATDARIFTPPPEGSVRRGTCYYGEKYKVFSGKPLPPPVEGSVEILREGPGVQTREEIIELFRTSEFFYCYESSALSMEAVLCGCPVVLIPNDHYTKPLLVKPFDLTGMAWGDSPEEIERAKKTVSQGREKYDEWIDKGFRQLDQFIEESQSKALQTPYPEKVRFPVFYSAPSKPSASIEVGIRKIAWLLTPPVILQVVWLVLPFPDVHPRKSLIKLVVWQCSPPIVLNLIWRFLPSPPALPDEHWTRRVFRLSVPPLIPNMMWRISQRFSSERRS